MEKEKKFILVSMEDERIKKISEVLGSKTSKKIVDILAENSELSEKDISDKLKLPINTVEYNLKKLIASEIVEKTKNFFWSKKGKKIPIYKLSNKTIIIAPKSNKISSKLKSLFPAFLVSGVGTFLVKIFSIESKVAIDSSSNQALFASEVPRDLFLDSTKEIPFTLFQIEPWIWFLMGSLLMILIFMVFNWRKL